MVSHLLFQERVSHLFPLYHCVNDPFRGGMIAPIVGGMLLMISRSVPVYTSVTVFTLAGACVLFLKEGDGDRTKSSINEIIH